MTLMEGNNWQSAMAERWERRRDSRPTMPEPPDRVPASQWRRRQLVGLVLALPILVVNGLWLGSNAVIVSVVLYATFFTWGEWKWRRYLRPPPLG